MSTAQSTVPGGKGIVVWEGHRSWKNALVEILDMLVMESETLELEVS